MSSTGTFLLNFLSEMPPASFTRFAQSLYCDTVVDSAPGPSGPDMVMA
jgi:hypothetical protein